MFYRSLCCAFFSFTFNWAKSAIVCKMSCFLTARLCALCLAPFLPPQLRHSSHLGNCACDLVRIKGHGPVASGRRGVEGEGGGSSGSLSPSCYEQGPPVCRLFQWGTEMNSMGGHGAPSQASASTNPTPELRRASHLRPLSSEGESFPISFPHTPSDTHTHTQRREGQQY